MKAKSVLLWAVGLGVVLVPLGAMAVMALQSRGEFEVPFDGTRLRACPDKPNCVCSQDVGAAAIDPLALGAGTEEAFDAFLAEAGSLPGAALVRREGAYAHLTFDSGLFGFRDDVEFLWEPGTPTVQVRSASRVGHSDLGANGERVEALRPLAGRAGS